MRDADQANTFERQLIGANNCVWQLLCSMSCVRCGGGGSILEAKFQTFEKRQEKVERQLETGFDSLQNQLRQVLMQFQVQGRSLLPARHHLPSYKSIYDSGTLLLWLRLSQESLP